MSLTVFLHCKNSLCEYDGRSRVNDKKNLVAVELVQKLMADCSLPADEFVIISPYRANLHHLQHILKEKSSDLAALVNATINTADSFQGREGQIVVFVLCVTGQTGPLFVANKNRICVSITRQISALFVVGDIDTSTPDTGSKEISQVQEGDDGESKLIKCKAFQYFRDNHRVVAMDGVYSQEPIID